MSDTTDTTPQATGAGGAELALPEPAPRIPPALANHKHAQLYRELRSEGRLAWLPASAATVSGGVDLWWHEAMLHALHTSPPAALLALLFGAATNGTAALVTTLILRRNGKAEGLVVKRVGWGSLAAGVVLTLFGAHAPVIDAAYVAAVAVATGPWHKRRWGARRALRRALLRHPGALADLARHAELDAPADQVIDATPDVADSDALNPAGGAHSAVSSTVDGGLVGTTSVELDALRTRWQRGVAPKHLPGTTLLDLRVYPDGRIAGVVDGGDNGVTLAQANSKRSDIAGALHLELPDAEGNGGQDVLFDQPGGLGLHRGQLRMQIVSLASATATSARVTEQLLAAPDNPYSIRLGGYIDDGSPAYWDLATDEGVWGGAIIAGSGLGKTSLVEVICYRARQLGFHVLYVDPTSVSSPILPHHTTWPALGEDQAIPALRMLEEAVETRQAWMTAHRGVGKILPGMIAPCALDGDRPNPDCPCRGIVPPPLQVVVEECNLVFGRPFPKTTIKQGVAWGELAQHVRKLGIGIIAVTQLPDVGAFGGVDRLRSNIAVHNMLAMHIRSNNGGTLIPGLPYNPKLIPAKAGRALLCGQASRTMELQLDRSPRREDAAQFGGVGPFAEDLYEALPVAHPHPADAAAADRWLPYTGADAGEAAAEEALDRLAEIMAGTPRTHPALPAAPAEPAAASMLGDTQLAWAAPVTVALAAPSGDELAQLEELWAAPTTAGLLGGLAREVLAVVADLAEDEWVTVGTLAELLGRVAAGADTQDRRRAAGQVGAELAAAGVATTKRAAGMSVRVADLRAALAR